MIIRQANRITKFASFLLTKTPLLLSTHGQSFSRLSEQLQSASYRNYLIKGSNVRFQDSNVNLLTYYSHPSIETKQNFTPKCYEIKESPILTLNFLHQAAEEFAKQAWENRKNVSLRFRDVMKLMKVEPFSNKTVTLKQTFQDGGPQDKTYTKELTVTDESQKGEVEMFLKQISACEHTKQQDTLWEVKIDIKYEDYAVFLQSIRSNLLYISGAKFSLEVTKEESIIELDTFTQTPTPVSKETPKKAAAKGAKTKKAKV